MDPSQFALFAIGGNGPVHATTLAESAGMTRIIIPPVAGLFSALGMLYADVEHQLVGAFYRRFRDAGHEDLNAAVAPLVEEGMALLKAQGFEKEAQRDITVHADVKYVGQTAPVPVRVQRFPADERSFGEIAEAFTVDHTKTFGFASEREALQFVSLKAVCRGIPDKPRMAERMARANERLPKLAPRKAYFGASHGWLEARIITRGGLEGRMPGPVIIEEYDTTSVVSPGWTASRDALNNIVLERGGA